MVGKAKVEGDFWNIVPKLKPQKMARTSLPLSFERYTAGSYTPTKRMRRKPTSCCADCPVIKLFQIVLPAISTGGFISTFAGTGWWGSIVGAVCSAVLLALNLYTRSYDLGKQAQQHRDSATQIWSVREKYLSLITDLAVGYEPLSDVQRKRDELLDDLKDIYANAPSTSGAAYKRAHKALNLKGEMTFSFAEVDAFLPEALRRAR